MILGLLLYKYIVVDMGLCLVFASEKKALLGPCIAYIVYFPFVLRSVQDDIHSLPHGTLSLLAQRPHPRPRRAILQIFWSKG